MNDQAERSVAAWLEQGRQCLPSENGRREAELLLAAAIRRDRVWLRTHDDAMVERTAAREYEVWLSRRAQGEPMAYLLQRREFWSLSLEVSPAVLIPRADTETLVEQALLRIPGHRRVRIADLGTGSGAIALAIASERPQAQIVATDASAQALVVARANIQACGLNDRVFPLGPASWFDALIEQPPFDVVVSNPPYIAAGDLHLQEGDLRFEPQQALVSGMDGLDAIRVLVAQARDYLLPGGWLLLEHGYDQGEAVRRLFADAGFCKVSSVRDLGGNERVSLGALGYAPEHQ